MSDNTNKVSESRRADFATISPSNAKDLLLNLWEFNNKATREKKESARVTACLSGDAGIGKTAIMLQVVKEFAKSKGLSEDEVGFITYVLSHLEREDILGLPFINPKDEKVYRMLHNPDLLNVLKYEFGLLFWDEWNRGPRPCLATFFAYLDHRGANGLYLPDGWFMTAAMNPASADYAVSAAERDPAFRRRLMFIELIPNLNDWVAWAKDAGIHYYISGFVQNNPNFLLDGKARDAGKVYANPAAWEKVSNLLENFLDRNISLNSPIVEAALSGVVGRTATTSLLAFIDGIRVPSAQEILSEYTTKASIKKKERTQIQEQVTSLIRYNPEVASSGDSKGSINQVLAAINAELYGKKIPPNEPYGKGDMPLAYNIVEFMLDLSNELLAACMSSAIDGGDDVENSRYLTQLSVEMNKHPRWKEIPKRMTEAKRKVEEQS